MNACSIDGCERVAHAFDLCHSHYVRRARGNSSPDLFIAHADRDLSKSAYHSRGRTPCSVDGCEKHVASVERGYCGQHDYKFRRYGDPLAGRSFRPRGSGTRYTDTSGYVVIRDASGVKQLEHRAVMAELLGRPLAPFENVHHINGIRDDNRPENLELWCNPQPTGQRASDLAAWVIATYPELIADLTTSKEPTCLASAS